MSQLNIIDLTQSNESDEDDHFQTKITGKDDQVNVFNPNVGKKTALVRSESTDLPSPILFVPASGSFEDPLGVPLVNTAHSIAYAFSSSNIDPFSNLIRLLHQNSSDNNALFFQLTQSLAFNAKPVEFLPILFQLIQSTSQPSFLRHLAIKSIIILSVNNCEFCAAVLLQTNLLIKISCENEDEYLDDILQLYQAVCDYATHDQADLIVHDIANRDLIHHVPSPEDKKTAHASVDPIRAKVHSILALLARYGDVFPDPIVEEINKKCNFPGKGSLSREIMWPSIVCIDQFLRQPQTSAYRVCQANKHLIVSKMTLAVIGCENQNSDNELRVMVLKVFLEVLDEFYFEDASSPTVNFIFQLTSALISMRNFAEEPVKKMAKILLKRFKV